jgi:hypothetical protein
MISIVTLAHPHRGSVFVGMDINGTIHYSWDGVNWNHLGQPW